MRAKFDPDVDRPSIALPYRLASGNEFWSIFSTRVLQTCQHCAFALLRVTESVQRLLFFFVCKIERQDKLIKEQINTEKNYFWYTVYSNSIKMKSTHSMIVNVQHWTPDMRHSK